MFIISVSFFFRALNLSFCSPDSADFIKDLRKSFNRLRKFSSRLKYNDNINDWLIYNVRFIT